MISRLVIIAVFIALPVIANGVEETVTPPCERPTTGSQRPPSDEQIKEWWFPGTGVARPQGDVH